MENVLFVATNDRLLAPFLTFLRKNVNANITLHSKVVTTKGIITTNPNPTTDVDVRKMDLIFLDTYEGENGYANMRNWCLLMRVEEKLKHDIRIFQVPLSEEGLRQEPSMFQYDMPSWTWVPYRLGDTQVDALVGLFAEGFRTEVA